MSPFHEGAEEFMRQMRLWSWMGPPTDPEWEEKLDQLVHEHLAAIGPGFDGVTTTVIRTHGQWLGAMKAPKSLRWKQASFVNAMAVRNVVVPERCQEWGLARDASRRLATICDPACDFVDSYVGHLVSGLPDNPWAPIMEMWAMGLAPVGVIDDEFVVYVR